MKTYALLAVAAMTVSTLGATPIKDYVGKRAEALPNETWSNSEWISAVDAPVLTGKITGKNERAADGASWFLTSVKNSAPVKSVKWMTSGLGVYDIYVNGKKIGKEILKPGFTHYAKTKFSFTYDITDAFKLKKGAVNKLAAQVTPGWWGDKIITPANHDGMIGKKPAFRGVLEITYADGTKKYYGTNTNDWRAGVAGPVKHAAIFDGEEYDANEAPGYASENKMGKPERNTEFRGVIYPSEGAEIYSREDLILSPVEAYTWKGVTGADKDHYGTINIVRKFKPGEEMIVNPGETLVVDFGQNCAAVPVFDFRAEKGTKLLCEPVELLNDGNGSKKRGMDGPEGTGHRLNLRVPDIGMQVKYTFGPDKGYVTYKPTRSFYGYRYMNITADKPVRIRDVKSLPVSSMTAELETGKLTTGNELVNKLISNTLWGQRSNYLSVPTDCPQRNERLGWTADTQVFAETGSFFADIRSFMHKWMRDMRDTQNEHGSYASVAPLAQYGFEYARLGWTDAGVIVPWIIWKQYGDKSIIDENWKSMEKFIDHMAETKYDHDALKEENGNYQYADWLSYEALEPHTDIFTKDANGKRIPKPEAHDYWNYLGASYWLIDAEAMLDMARATGRDVAKYEAMVKEARQYIKDNFINADGSFKSDTLNTMQTPALFALKNKVVEGSAKENMIKRLRKNFEDHGNCLQTGFLGTSILMPVLTENGMSDIAYELLFQRKNPSWLYSVDNGATTIWERWNSYMKDKGMGPKGMNSFNHYAYGCVCGWMWNTMAGIASDTAASGFSNIIMKPVPDRRLGFVDAEYNSAAGPVKSSWKYEGNDWVWTFTIPEGSTASVTLPGTDEVKTYPAGTHTVKCSL